MNARSFMPRKEWFRPAVVCLALVTWHAQNHVTFAQSDQPESAWQVEYLKRHGVELSAEGLLKYVRTLIPDDGIDDRIKSLIDRLGDSQYFVREAATQELTDLGEPALPWLREAFKSHDLEISVRAKIVAERIGLRLDTGVRDALSLAVMHQLKRFRSPEALPLLLKVLPQMKSHMQRDTIHEAIWANASFKVHEELLVDEIKKNDARTLAVSLVALEISTGEKSVELLGQYLADFREEIRLATARALLNHRPQQCLTVLLALLDSKDFETRMHAVWLLSDLTGHRFGLDGRDNFQAATTRWKTWAKTKTSDLELPVGTSRLDLMRALLLFHEPFALNQKIDKTYGRMRYETSLPAVARVQDGILYLESPAREADQSLFVESKTLLGEGQFPRSFVIKTKMGGENKSAGVWHVGLSVGDIKFLFHPGYNSGGFRVERRVSHDYITRNEDMGLNPGGNALFDVTLRVKRDKKGDVEFDYLAVDPRNPNQKFQKQIKVDRKSIPRIDRIGLERSGNSGGAGMYGPLQIEFDPSPK